MADPKKKKLPAKKADKEGTTAISIRLPTDLQIKAREKSERTGVPISFVIRKALEEWVNKREVFAVWDPKDDKQ